MKKRKGFAAPTESKLAAVSPPIKSAARIQYHARNGAEIRSPSRPNTGIMLKRLIVAVSHASTIRKSAVGPERGTRARHAAQPSSPANGPPKPTRHSIHADFG